MNGPSYSSYLRYLKVTRARYANPYTAMIEDIKKRLCEEHNEFLRFLSDPRRLTGIITRLFNASEIASRLSRLISLEAEYNQSLQTILRFTSLVNAYMQRTRLFADQEPVK